MPLSTITPTQAWAILARHVRDDIAPLRLQELCRDPDRVSALVTVHHSQEATRMWLADLSRQKMTVETLQHLLRLAASTKLHEWIKSLAWGPNDPNRPVLPERMQQKKNGTSDQQQQHVWRTAPTNSNEGATTKLPPQVSTETSDANFNWSNTSLHMVSRIPYSPDYSVLTVPEGRNLLEDLHQQRKRFFRSVNAIRNSPMQNVIVVGQGVPLAALRFLNQALQHDERAMTATTQWKDVDDQRSSNSGGTASLARLRRNLQGVVSGQHQDQHNDQRRRRLFLVPNMDPVATADAIRDLDPAVTLVVSIALAGMEETGLATKLLKNWLLQGLCSPEKDQKPHRNSSTPLRSNHPTSTNIIGNNSHASKDTPDAILARHVMLVTANDRIAATINKPESVQLLPAGTAEAMTSTTSAVLLPLAVVYGEHIAREVLAGAHDMDKHWVETNPRHNVPVLLALADVWNAVLQQQSPQPRIVSTVGAALQAYPSFVAAVEAQTCSHRERGAYGPAQHPSTTSFSARPQPMPLVMDGGNQGVYDRALYQAPTCGTPVNVELVSVLDQQVDYHTRQLLGSVENQLDVHTTADAMMCSLFAHCDELAFGPDRGSGPTMTLNESMSGGSPSFGTVMTGFTNGTTIGNRGGESEGNRPSMLLLTDRLDAFACGQLIALTEHRAVVKAHLWGMDPFVKEVGSSLRSQRGGILKEELHQLMLKEGDDDEGTVTATGTSTLSTKTILQHYAALVKTVRNQASSPS